MRRVGVTARVIAAIGGVSLTSMMPGCSPAPGVRATPVEWPGLKGSINGALLGPQGELLLYETRRAGGRTAPTMSDTYEWKVDGQGVPGEIGVVCSGVARDVVLGPASSRWALCITQGARDEVGTLWASERLGAPWQVVMKESSFRRLIGLPGGPLVVWSGSELLHSVDGGSWVRWEHLAGKGPLRHLGDMGIDRKFYVLAKESEVLGLTDGVPFNAGTDTALPTHGFMALTGLAAVRGGYVYVQSSEAGDSVRLVTVTESPPTERVTWERSDHRIVEVASDGDQVVLMTTSRRRDRGPRDLSHSGFLLVSIDGARTWREVEFAERIDVHALGNGMFFMRKSMRRAEIWNLASSNQAD